MISRAGSSAQAGCVWPPGAMMTCFWICASLAGVVVGDLSDEFLPDYMDAPHKYLGHRGVLARVGTYNVRLSLTMDSDDVLAVSREACEKVYEGNQDQVDECTASLEALVRSDVSEAPHFLAASATAERERLSEEVPFSSADRAYVEIVSPEQGARTASRGSSFFWKWRIANGEDFRLGTDGVACFDLRDDDERATVNQMCATGLDETPDGLQLVKLFTGPQKGASMSTSNSECV